MSLKDLKDLATLTPPITDALPTPNVPPIAPPVTEPVAPVKPEEGIPEASKYDTWTKEDFVKELSKVRQEAASHRIDKKTTAEEYEAKLKEQDSQFTAYLQSFEERIAPQLTKAQEYEKLLQEKIELEKMKEDKKRSLEEKIDYRDKEIAAWRNKAEEMNKQLENSTSEYQKMINELQQKVESSDNFYQKQIDNELNSISLDYRRHAEIMVMGCETKQEALDMLKDAKSKKLFENTVISVSHETPSTEVTRTLTSPGRVAGLDEMDPSNKERGRLKIKQHLKEHGGLMPINNKGQII